MWVGIIVTTIFGGIILGCCIWGIIECYNPKNYIDRDVYRRKIEKEKYDYIDFFGGACYESEMTEEQKIRYKKYNKKLEKMAKIKKRTFIGFTVMIYMLAIIGFGFLGAFIENEELALDIEKYKASKYTIELSIQNEDLTGLERMELVKEASKQNSWLAKTQYEVKQWYRFYLNKNVILKLEMINFE